MYNSHTNIHTYSYKTDAVCRWCIQWMMLISHVLSWWHPETAHCLWALQPPPYATRIHYISYRIIPTASTISSINDDIIHLGSSHCCPTRDYSNIRDFSVSFRRSVFFTCVFFLLLHTTWLFKLSYVGLCDLEDCFFPLVLFF